MLRAHDADFAVSYNFLTYGHVSTKDQFSSSISAKVGSAGLFGIDGEPVQLELLPVLLPALACRTGEPGGLPFCKASNHFSKDDIS